MDVSEWAGEGINWEDIKRLLAFALRAVVIGGPVAVIAHWMFVDRGLYISRWELCLWLGILVWVGVEVFLYRQKQPQKIEIVFDEKSGYYRLRLSELGWLSSDESDVCFATRPEEDKIPEPRREGSVQVVGKIHCIVEGKFWVWKEM